MDCLYKPAIACFLVLNLGFSLTASARSPLSFEERVKAQEAIERVYYNHRIWPKENPQPKPPFEELVPREVLEAKVTDYLKKCAALDRYWQRTITTNQLQAEMDRMARGTRDGTLLQELFAALGNDPLFVAECLARSILADRLARSWYSADPRFHLPARVESETPLALRRVIGAGVDGAEVEEFSVRKRPFEQWWAEEAVKFPAVSESLPSEVECAFVLPRAKTEWGGCAGGWAAGALEQTPDPKVFHSAVWTGTEMILFGGGQSVQLSPTASGARYEPATDRWTLLPEGYDTGSPSARYQHTAVWTGTEMLVWGGLGIGNVYLSGGGRYNPVSDEWAELGTGGLDGRSGHSAVWTGQEMIIWGGFGGAGTWLRTGARFRPDTGTWVPLPEGGCPTARYGHVAVWTGTEMLVWGGDQYRWDNTGARFNPATGSWAPIATGSGAPPQKTRAVGVWSGQEMLVWGGYPAVAGEKGSGGRYDPKTNTWRTMTKETGCPSARSYHRGVWTGGKLMIWGGMDADNIPLGDGSAYAPQSDTWTHLSAQGSSPAPRFGHTAIWSGDEMIVWGGIASGIATATGGRYAPSTDSWVPTGIGDGPSARSGHSAVWTGAEMIVWGGTFSQVACGDGGRYAPGTDSWQSVSGGGGAPTARAEHRAVWTGESMVLWGGSTCGESGWSYLNSGASYAPASDTWSALPTGPSARASHTLLWTGEDLIVWGGHNNAVLGDGAILRPGAVSWDVIPAGGQAPQAREGHTAIWTGGEVVIWGGNKSVGSGALGTGGRYSPLQGTWAPTSVLGGPAARAFHTSVWTGDRMVVYGGRYQDTAPFSYDPGADAWTALDPGGPYSADWASAVWTGDAMIIWGGRGIEGATREGGIFTPADNSWRLTPADPPCPAARYGHSAVWTGESMIVWGGTPATATGGMWKPTPPPAGAATPELTDLNPCAASGILVRWQSDAGAWNDDGTGRHFTILKDGAPLQTGPCAGQIPYGTTECLDDAGGPSPHRYAVAYTSGCGLTAVSAEAEGTDLTADLQCSVSPVPESPVAGQAVDFVGIVAPDHCAAAARTLWSFGDGASSEGHRVTHVYALPGAFTWAMVSDTEGNRCSAEGTVLVRPPTPGDCDSDGAVSIGEVQKAINMFLGNQAPGCGVDCNGDGTVSIGEVQKVINAFLGVSSSC